MEWVETTSKTIEEAKDTLLDQLGVDEEEAEFEIVEEPKVGLFGRSRGPARVRARIRPKSPRAKDDRRRQGGRRNQSKANASGGGGWSSGDGRATAGGDGETAPTPEPAQAQPAAGRSDSESRDRPERGPREGQRSVPTETADPEEIAGVVGEFLTGLVGAFGVEATVATSIEEGHILAEINGEQLGYLIGPKGGVIDAIQELSRTFSQKESKGKQAPRLRVDVGAYRANRKIELEQFVRGVAEEVMSTGAPYAFEPMGSADRKTVHDTAGEIDGLESRSEGEDPRRKVVIAPA